MKFCRWILILSLLLLSSCVFLTEGSLSNITDENSFLNRFPDNQKSIVIVKITGNIKNITWWCNQKNLIKHSDDNCFKIRPSKQYQIMMLEPGSYHFFSYFKNHKPFFISPKEIYNSKKNLTIFEAKAGEISYIGDLSLSRSSRISKKHSGEFRIKDSFKKLDKILSGKSSKKAEKLFPKQVWEIKYLVKNYSNLKDRLKTRLAYGFKSEESVQAPKETEDR
jgi:hypothetical protein